MRFVVRAVIAGALAQILVSLWTNTAQAQTSQLITLQPGWNLITFQVLPQDRSPEAVFGALHSEETGQPLYNKGNPQQSRLRGAYELSSVNTADPNAPDFAWRTFE